MIKKMIKKNSVIRKIVGENTACEEAIKWLTKHKNKLDNWLWEHCDRPDWMVWFLQKSELPLPKEMWVKIASAPGYRSGEGVACRCFSSRRPFHPCR